MKEHVISTIAKFDEVIEHILSETSDIELVKLEKKIRDMRSERLNNLVSKYNNAINRHNNNEKIRVMFDHKGITFHDIFCSYSIQLGLGAPSILFYVQVITNSLNVSYHHRDTLNGALDYIQKSCPVILVTEEERNIIDNYFKDLMNNGWVSSDMIVRAAEPA